MPHTINCPHCSTRLNLPEMMAGQVVKCPRCQSAFPAPAVEPPAAPGTSAAISLQLVELLPEPNPPSTEPLPGLPLPPAVGRRVVLPWTDHLPDDVPGRWAAIGTVLFLTLIVMDEVFAFSVYWRLIGLLDRSLAQKSKVGRPAVETLAEQEATAHLIGMLLAVGVLVFYCVWMFHAHRNLRLFGAEGLAYSPGWAAGANFIPFVNFVLPYLIAQEIWKASDPNVTMRSGREWQRTSESGFIVLWWMSAVVRLILVGWLIVRRLDGPPTTLDSAHLTLYLWMADTGASIIGALAAVSWLKQLLDRQASKLEQRREATDA